MTTSESQQREFIREAASAKGPYGDVQPAQSEHFLLRVKVTGEADPNLPSRVLDILTIRGNLPLKFTFVRDVPSGIATIQIEVLVDEVPLSKQLLERILKIPTVISADFM